MALIRICDRCEAEGAKTVQIRLPPSNRLDAPPQAVKDCDLCPRCVKKLDLFLSGDYGCDNCDSEIPEEETKDSESKTKQDENVLPDPSCVPEPSF